MKGGRYAAFARNNNTITAAERNAVGGMLISQEGDKYMKKLKKIRKK